MSTILDATHDPKLRSWVGSANVPGCDFPIQNLPFAVFRRLGSGENFRCGAAIGDRDRDIWRIPDRSHTAEGKVMNG